MLKIKPFRDTPSCSNAPIDEVGVITHRVAALKIHNDKENNRPYEAKSKTMGFSSSKPSSERIPLARKPLGLLDSPGPKQREYIYYTVSTKEITQRPTMSHAYLTQSELAPHRQPVGSAANQANFASRKTGSRVEPSQRKMVLMR